MLDPAGAETRSSANGRVTGLETIEVRRCSIPTVDSTPGSSTGPESVLACDSVILAIGQAPDLSWIGPEDGDRAQRTGDDRGRSRDPRDSADWIYAGGDVAFGPRNLIDAIADGRRAAASIHRQIAGEDPPIAVPSACRKLLPIVEVRGRTTDYTRVSRVPIPAELSERRIGSPEVELGYTPERGARGGVALPAVLPQHHARAVASASSAAGASTSAPRSASASSRWRRSRRRAARRRPASALDHPRGTVHPLRALRGPVSHRCPVTAGVVGIVDRSDRARTHRELGARWRRADGGYATRSGTGRSSIRARLIQGERALPVGHPSPVDLDAPRPGADVVPELLPAPLPGEGARKAFCASATRSGSGSSPTVLFVILVVTGDVPHVLLHAGGGLGVRRHAAPADQRRLRAAGPQRPPLVGAPDGARRSLLHLARVFYAGAYKQPRQFNWVIGVVLLCSRWRSRSPGTCCRGTSCQLLGGHGRHQPRPATCRCCGGRLQDLLIGGEPDRPAPPCCASTRCTSPCCPSLSCSCCCVHIWRVRKDGFAVAIAKERGDAEADVAVVPEEVSADPDEDKSPERYRLLGRRAARDRAARGTGAATTPSSRGLIS